MHASCPLATRGHTLPHVPQFDVVEMLVSQPLLATPSQSAYGSLHWNWQEPALQKVVAFGTAGQTVPHVPQFAGSVPRSVHCDPHCDNPAGQLTTHVPFEHAASGPQVFPHAPQFCVVVRSLS
jgi:hypothetical protein